MKGINRVKLRFRMIAALLLLVNGLCTAAPALYALTGNEGATAGILFNHGVNTLEAEEEQVLTSVYTVKRKIKEAKLISFLSAFFRSGNHSNTYSQAANYYISYSSLLPLPGYYSFLFRFYLF